MAASIREMIKAEAYAEREERATSIFSDAAPLFDRWVPTSEMAALADAEIRPALEEFIELQAGAWRCTIEDVGHALPPVGIYDATGRILLNGLAMRFSRLFAMHVIAEWDDPHCAVLHDPVAGRAFWLTVLRGQEPVVEPLSISEITRDQVLERIGAFVVALRAHERAFPFRSFGMEPLPRLDRGTHQ